MYTVSVRIEEEQQIIDLRYKAAKLLGIDVTSTDHSMVVRAAIRILGAYLSAVLMQPDPKKWETFRICFLREEGLLKNYTWKQSKQLAREEKTAVLVFKQMMQILQEESKRKEEETILPA